jgi:hypothetical protein
MNKSWITLVIVAAAASASAQVSFTGSYSQNFDTLANSGTANAWTDNTTLAGWYMRRVDDVNGVLANQYNAGDGTSNAGAVYSFGSTGSAERALGSVGSGSVEHMAYGVRLTNNTGSAISSLNLSFIGEQWRDGGNTTPVAQSQLFSYSLTSTVIGADIQASGGVAGYTADPNFTRVASFDITSPVFGTTATALDGNLAANRVSIAGTLTLGTPWANGTDLWLRWVDINDVGNDMGLGVDQLSVTSVPEPASMALLGIGALALLRRRRK